MLAQLTRGAADEARGTRRTDLIKKKPALPEAQAVDEARGSRRRLSDNEVCGQRLAQLTRPGALAVAGYIIGIPTRPEARVADDATSSRRFNA